MTVDSSSSSGMNPELALILDNLAAFRAYSLDPSLIEEYFNKGVLVPEVDLDAVQSSSSSSGDSFSLTISLTRNYTDPLQRIVPFPEDLQLYVYDETVNGVASPGMVSAEKIVGVDGVVITLQSLVPDGSDEYAFQLNVEHPELEPYSMKFRFRGNMPYLYDALISYQTFDSPTRLSPEYISYLLAWMTQFWAGYDLDPNFTAPINHPPDRQYLHFDPFAHARWKLGSDLAVRYSSWGGLKSLADNPTRVPPVVAGWNFLGVFPETWKCMNPDPPAQGLYLITKNDKGLIDREKSGGDFDCKDYSVAMIFFLRKQLQTQCPNAKVYIQYVGTKLGAKHALLLVDLGGSDMNFVDGVIRGQPELTPAGADCCSGKFLYDPQNGAVFNTVGELCQGRRTVYCGDGDFSWWRTTAEGNETENNKWKSEWADDENAMARIKNVVCDCVRNSNPLPGSSEEVINNKCQEPDDPNNNNPIEKVAFNKWFIDNFKFDSGKTSSPMTDIPQILNCDGSLCMPYPSSEEDKCLKTDRTEGVTPYACELRCVKKWDCPCRGDDNVEVSSYSLGGFSKPYIDEAQCVERCEEGSWCPTVDGAQTGECKYATRQEYLDAKVPESVAFHAGVACLSAEHPEGTNCCPTCNKVKAFYVEGWDSPEMVTEAATRLGDL